ncbi:hypothetical protein PR048_004262 [Dryococelus australis]|uniref:Uncharacterized protein n=1 Tax=Dryococelus australis TaxID=614101 RepID=A0ABQ9I5F9_9NEOP|nr:hypothetical protein PR048_004262 [Dryococelus australis]
MSRGRTPEWYNKSYGHICGQYLTRIRTSFKHSADGPESKPYFVKRKNYSLIHLQVGPIVTMNHSIKLRNFLNALCACIFPCLYNVWKKNTPYYEFILNFKHTQNIVVSFVRR